MENKKSSNKDKLKHSLCYLPFGWIVIYFIEQNKSAELMKHIKYWSYLFFGFILIRLILVWLLWIPIGSLLFLVYLWIAGFFWHKAYKWDEVKIDYFDSFEEKVKDNYDWETSASTTTSTASSQEVKKEPVVEEKIEPVDEFEGYDPDEDEKETVIDTGSFAMNGIAKWINKVVWDVKDDEPDVFDDTKNEDWTKKEVVEEKKRDDDVLNF